MAVWVIFRKKTSQDERLNQSNKAITSSETRVHLCFELDRGMSKCISVHILGQSNIPQYTTLKHKEACIPLSYSHIYRNTIVVFKLSGNLTRVSLMVRVLSVPKWLNSITLAWNTKYLNIINVHIINNTLEV